MIKQDVVKLARELFKIRGLKQKPRQAVKNPMGRFMLTINFLQRVLFLNF
jgi:hypothetical protein